MTSDIEFDRQLQEYLQAGPVELSDRVLWAARAQISTTRRRGRLDRFVPWREVQMSQSMRLLLAGGGALALVVAIAAGLFSSLLGQRTTGPGASHIVSPSLVAPSVSPSPATSASAIAVSTPAPTFQAPIVARTDAKDVAAAWSVTALSLWTPYLAPDGRIWVPSNEDDRIRMYDQNGKLVDSWGTSETGAKLFFFGAPGAHRDGAGLVFAPDGSFYVLDSGNFRVQHFAADLKLLGKFGSYGSDPGQFVSPVGIALDDGGYLYVSDDGRNDVQVFTTGGTYVRTVAAGAAGYGVWGSGPGWFITTSLTDDDRGAIEYHADGTVQGGWDLRPWGCDPSGVTRDQSPRNIYITCAPRDGGPGYLFRFDQTGSLLRAWRVNGAGIAVNAEGTAAFVVSPDGTTLSRYDLEAPIGG
ncbi:MAG TPA: NHL repeat-containing protein [Candidatus Limnocylindrales bacterium]|nr:NHL repeat-containing protein [Candidatus Limnocylindrales bacterium]